MLPLIFLGISLVVALFMFQAVAPFNIHWGLKILLAVTPVILTLFFGLFGLIGSAFLTGALFKIS